MGILKHVILPLFAVIHAQSIYACRSLDSWAELVELAVESDDDRASTRQRHMVGCLRAFNAAMLLLCVAGVVTESAHYRGVMVLAELVFFSVVTADAFQNGLNYYVPGTMAAVALVGAGIHAMEPGIFTKDKTKAKTK